LGRNANSVINGGDENDYGEINFLPTAFGRKIKEGAMRGESGKDEIG
jgi:hypothetical protein